MTEVARAQRSTSPRRLPRFAREQQMVAVSRELFANRGYAAVTMDDVAAAVGITKPLLYSYFRNKEQLYLAAMTPAGEALVAEVTAAVGKATGAAEALQAGLTAFFSVLDRDRAAWRVLFDESLPSSSVVSAAVEAYRARLAGLVEQSFRNQLGGLAKRAGKGELGALAAVVFGAAEGVCRWWLREGKPGPAEVAALLTEVLGPGLARQARRLEGGGPDG